MVLLTVMPLTIAAAQVSPTSKPPATEQPGSGNRVEPHKEPTKQDLLIGSYGPYRANNDLLSYKLTLRVDPEKKTIAGSNTIRFQMLEDAQRLQLELASALHIDGIEMSGKPLHFEREPGADRTLWIDFTETLPKGSVHEVVFRYSGTPVTQGRFGCFSFDKDTTGKPWITTACEGEGPSIWWPNKDQWRDEPQDGMELDIAVPTGLMDVSNGKFEGSKDLGDGYTAWRWHVHYPINNYDVALNIAAYAHFTGPQHGPTTLDYYVLPADLEKARQQFAQVPEMLDAYEHYFGEYPFAKDGYKLVQVPYAGMEHQSAVAYGNHFKNGYLERDWTGVGISSRFDFIIIHESGHEWFGNAVTAQDLADMWIHEGWTTYMETLYVEYRFGKAEALRYVNGMKPKVRNTRPIIPPHGINLDPPQDQYFKGALMLNTLRSVIDDDAKWFADLHDFYQHFKYQNISTDDVVQWWSEQTGESLGPFFNEYLRHAALPTLEWQYDKTTAAIEYRWVADEPEFAMPIKAGDPQHWTVLTPTSTWHKIPWILPPEAFKVATELYYVTVSPPLESTPPAAP